MRLLNTHTFALKEFVEDEVGRYLALSHRWGRDELTFQDLRDGAGTYHDKQGYHKAYHACQVAKSLGYHWVWIDTCCIDKTNSVELSEAINAMYRWYQKSDFCIAYLVDYTHGRTALSHSSWFKRCWTLQELIAPPNVRFYDRNWTFFGSKHDEQLCAEISRITRISRHVLLGGDPKEYSIAQRLSWAADRKATRIEDETYSLLGILGISMSTKYGTGAIVFRSLQKKLLRDMQKQDLSLLAWARLPGEQVGGSCGLLAPSPAHFSLSHNVQSIESESREMIFWRDCVELEAVSVPHAQDIYLCILPCTSTNPSYRRAIFLQRLKGGERYARLLRGETGITNIHTDWIESQPLSVCCSRKFFIDHCPTHPPRDWLPGFNIRHINLPGYRASSTGTAYALSRCGERFDLNHYPIMLQLPPDQWGTTGVIYIPAGRPNASDLKIRRIKVGFDADFRPTVWLGKYKSTETARRMHQVIQPDGELAFAVQNCRWDNTWLDKYLPCSRSRTSGVSRSGSEEVDGEEQFRRKGFERHKALDDRGFDLELMHLGIRLRLTLEDLPQPQPEQGTGPILMSSWKVWTLEIDKLDSPIPVDATNKRIGLWGGLVAASMVLSELA